MTKFRVYYVVEDADWSIKHDGQSLIKYLKAYSFRITLTHRGIRNSIIHFGSVNTFMAGTKVARIHKSNKVVVTWFHINPGAIDPALVKLADKTVDKWHTSNSITRKRLIDFGIPENKIIMIPLGVNTEIYKQAHDNKKTERNEFGIPNNAFVIGSFQKDGVGWGVGNEPKLIKGPDILCDVIAKVNQKHKNIFILLSGPARGYVKKQLDKIKVRYMHRYFESAEKVVKYYQLADIYLICSRAEGGPKSLLEAMASRVPVVATRVGMCADIIKNNKNGLLVDQEDTNALVDAILKLAENRDLFENVSESALKTIRSYDWRHIALKYKKHLYEAK